MFKCDNTHLQSEIRESSLHITSVVTSLHKVLSSLASDISENGEKGNLHITSVVVTLQHKVQSSLYRSLPLALPKEW